MATISSWNKHIDTSNLPFGVAFDNEFFLYTSNRLTVPAIGKDYAYLYGTGFKATPYGPVTGGTVKEIVVYINSHYTFSLSGISVSAPEFFSWKGRSSLQLAQTFLAGNDKITGSSVSDALSGFSGNDRISGGGGADRILGGDGADTLNGGPGKDRLAGGSGRDSFVFDTSPDRTKIDSLTDFSVQDDTIRLSKSTFQGILDRGTAKAATFWIGAQAHDITDRIIYNKKTGVLFYDPDGIGPTEQIAFAKVAKSLKLTSKDFFIV